MFYQVKLQWSQPKEGGDEMEKKRKSFLVNALSCTEAEAKILTWVPSSYQDPSIKGIVESPIVEIKSNSDSEDWWIAKLGDENDKGKLVPFLVAINGSNHLEVVKKLDSLYSTSEFLEIKKFAGIVDDELITHKDMPDNSLLKDEDFDESDD